MTDQNYNRSRNVALELAQRGAGENAPQTDDAQRRVKVVTGRIHKSREQQTKTGKRDA